MRSTAIAFCLNAPRLIACIGSLIAGTLIVGLDGYGPAATIIGLFFILGFLLAPFLPETKGRPFPASMLPLATSNPCGGQPTDRKIIGCVDVITGSLMSPHFVAAEAAWRAPFA
jgi:hypothetical protein